ncbi:hypothetical protein V3C99_017700 [Haemonchus contortus]|uniref:CCHC-type domain-containing protein n=1 Tax=Haemonchus contortus TaxID=6289 RepID=A0A7I4Z5D8_HAECO|nr:unnamed protein product [Haemonchus contortus]
MNAFEEDFQRIKDSPLKVENNNEGERPSTDNEKKDTTTSPSVTVGEEASIKQLSDGEVAEDVLEFEYEDAHQEIEDGVPEKERNATRREKDEVHETVKQRRGKLLSRMEGLKQNLHSKRHVPRRIIPSVNILRTEETYIRCGFCNEKEQHYSDRCPRFRDVDARERRVWCRNCLNTLHSTDRCWRRRMRCRYRGLDSH